MSNGPATDDAIVVDPFFQSLVKTMFEFWLTPEIEKRKSEGRWPLDWFTFAQVLLGEDGVTVNFDNEIVGTVEIDPKIHSLVPGQQYGFDDVKLIGSMKKLKLPNEFSDHGHVTLLNGGVPAVLFDFRRYKGSAHQFIDLAEQYLVTSEDAYNRGNIGPLLDNLFNACELIARARLMILTVSPSGRTHGITHSGINLQRRLGNVGNDFVDLFNYLTRTRDGARYDPRKLRVRGDEGDSLLIVRAEIDEFRRRH